MPAYNPSAMHQLEITTTFSAAHAIVMAGEREPLHGHDWKVTAVVEGRQLDDDGLLMDFHALEKALGEITRPFHHRNLNETPPFDRVNPTAEHVAQHIYEQLSAWLATWVAQRPKTTRPSGGLPVDGVIAVASVRVTEAVGCAAVFRP